jgi:hypothetical protein
MASLSFTNVSTEGFVAFTKELTEGEWGAIDITSYEGPGRTAIKSLCDTPTVVLCKLRLRWSIGELEDARAGARNAKQLDREWDSAQKRLRGLLDVMAADRDEQTREAAARLQNSLLLGAGVGQTQLKYQQEVDFGHQQVKLVSSGQAAADLALLGLQAAIAGIQQTTEALALGIGHGETSDRPSQRLRAAVTACSSMFKAVAEQLAWITDHGEVSVDRDRAAKLLASLEALAARYPATTEEPADEGPPTSGS